MLCAWKQYWNDPSTWIGDTTPCVKKIGARLLSTKMKIPPLFRILLGYTFSPLHFTQRFLHPPFPSASAVRCITLVTMPWNIVKRGNVICNSPLLWFRCFQTLPHLCYILMKISKILSADRLNTCCEVIYFPAYSFPLAYRLPLTPHTNSIMYFRYPRNNLYFITM